MKIVVMLVCLSATFNLIAQQWQGINPIYTNSNVGIGTSTPANQQGYDRVVNVDGPNNSKFVVSSSGNYRIGMYSHPGWNGGGGFIGTETNHSLKFMTNYVPRMTLDIDGNLGVGTNSPGAKLSFVNTDESNMPEGITWYNPSPLLYGIYRTPGSWTAPNYQQMKLSFMTGIVLDPGSAYVKSYVEIGGGGLRVSSGNVGIGTTSPGAKLDVAGPLTGNGATIFVNGGGDVMLNTGGSLFFDGNYSYSLGNYIRPVGLNTQAFFTSGSERVRITPSGNVGIGTTNPNQRLTVNGTIYGKEVKVDLSVPGPDYVFEKEYALPSLESIQAYVDQHKHLPEVPSANEMEANGINLSEMNMLLLKKVEELTLYVIDQQKQIEQLKTAINKK